MVKQFEGLVLTAYNDGTGTLTIGYGHTAGVYPGQVITPTTAEAYLEQDLGRAEGIVATLAPPGLTDNQFSALVDFTFNLGPGALQQMLAHGVDQVPVQMLRWDHEGPVVVPGLARRRQAEVDLWQSA
jgi:GH24 family phage-related lysozyme (muramidase)